MTFRWVINIRVNSPLKELTRYIQTSLKLEYKFTRLYLKYIFELFGFGMRLPKKPGEMDVEESGDMTQVKQTDMSQINRFLEKHRRGNHATRDEVPDSPQVLPILD